MTPRTVSDYLAEEIACGYGQGAGKWLMAMLDLSGTFAEPELVVEAALFEMLCHFSPAPAESAALTFLTERGYYILPPEFAAKATKKEVS